MRSTALPVSDTTTRTDSITLLRLGRILNFFKSLDSAERQEVLHLAGKHAETVPDKIPVADAPWSVKTHAVKRREIGKMLLGFFLRMGPFTA